MRVDRPIIFSTPMIRALLDGRKTQTRRLAWRDHRQDTAHVDGEAVETVVTRKPSPWQRVKPGDRLWVRESWRQGVYEIYFRADGEMGRSTRWCPSIHMPRWASRLTLTVTATKIERLQEISEEEARMEGVEGEISFTAQYTTDRHYYSRGFAKLWDELHGSGSWDANPEVVALTFTVEKRNIDAGDVPSDTEPKERA